MPLQASKAASATTLEILSMVALPQVVVRGTTIQGFTKALAIGLETLGVIIPCLELVLGANIAVWLRRRSGLSREIQAADQALAPAVQSCPSTAFQSTLGTRASYLDSVVPFPAHSKEEILLAPNSSEILSAVAQQLEETLFPSTPATTDIH
jgi:hypothetical protein